MLKVKQALNHSVQFYGFHVPAGAVYAVVPARTVNGRTMSKYYAWVEDLEGARNRRHFTMHVLRVNDKFPRRIYVDGLYGVAHALQDYILQNVPRKNVQVKRGATLRELAPSAPKDRKVGQYVMRGRPSYDTAPSVSTQKFVTDGCRIGSNFYTDEGYWGEVMHMGAPNFR